MNRACVILAVAASLLCVAVMTGCTNASPRFVDEGRSLSADEALELSLDVDGGVIAGRSVSEAKELRFDALAAMRREGGKQADAAAIITRGLPEDSRSVPFYVEFAEVDSVPAIIVVEAIGPKSGLLEDERVWVLDSSGKVLLAVSR